MPSPYFSARPFKFLSDDGLSLLLERIVHVLSKLDIDEERISGPVLRVLLAEAEEHYAMVESEISFRSANV